MYGIVLVLADASMSQDAATAGPNAAAERASCWACVDGGGTGTRVRLMSAGGRRVLGSGQAGPSALGQGIAQAWQNIGVALAASFADARLATLPAAQVALGLGLSGAEVAPWRAQFLAADPGYAHCALASDATALLLGAHAGGAGVIVIGGTGSVGMQRTRDGTVHKVGGWGFGLGDEGSGAWLGQQAVQHLTRVMDGRAAPAALAAALQREVGSHPAQVIAWCRDSAHGQEAHGRLAQLVFCAAEQGDAAAEALLQRASQELAALVRALDRQAPDLPVVASGSIAERLVPRWPAELRQRVVPPKGDAFDGACTLLRESLVDR
jgi:glucosamine kinase